METEPVELFEEGHFWASAKLQLFLTNVRGKKVLEIGCGSGYLTKKLASAGYEVTALDTDPAAIRHIGKHAKIKAVCGDFLKFDTKERFDTILLPDVIEHISDDVTALRKCHSLLKPSGRILVNVPALKALFGRHDTALCHKRRYSKQELLSKAASTGFSVEQARYWNLVGVIPHLIVGRILGRDLISLHGSMAKRNATNSILKAILSLELRHPPPLGASIFLVAKKVGV